MKNNLNDIESFSKFSGLRPNLDKCKITGIGVLKNVNVALCDEKYQPDWRKYKNVGSTYFL